jgi:CHASE1-domain containing sensor protein
MGSPFTLQNGVSEYLARLVALKTLFESSNRDVTRGEFERFIGHLFEDHPGLVRVSWIPRVRHDERAEYEKAAVEDGIPGYRFRSVTAEGAVVPAPESDEYYPVYYSTEPRTAAIYGFNVASDPVRRAAIERARDSDAIATLAAHRRHVQAGNPHGVVVSIPVYAKGSFRNSVADRRRNLSGFVSGVLELSRLLNTIVATAPSSGLDLHVYAADGSLVAQSPGGSASASSTSWLHDKLLHAVAP